MSYMVYQSGYCRNEDGISVSDSGFAMTGACVGTVKPGRSAHGRYQLCFNMVRILAQKGVAEPLGITDDGMPALAVLRVETKASLKRGAAEKSDRGDQSWGRET